MTERKSEFIIKDGNRILHKNIDDHDKAVCPVCKREIVPYWESRYNGVRGTCNVCGVNWAES